MNCNRIFEQALIGLYKVTGIQIMLILFLWLSIVIIIIVFFSYNRPGSGGVTGGGVPGGHPGAPGGMGRSYPGQGYHHPTHSHLSQQSLQRKELVCFFIMLEKEIKNYRFKQYPIEF